MANILTIGFYIALAVVVVVLVMGLVNLTRTDGTRRAVPTS
jgi:hypothetical protein